VKPPRRLLDHLAEREQRLLVETGADQAERHPCESLPAERMTGQPAMFTATEVSLRYISMGSRRLSPMPNAADASPASGSRNALGKTVLKILLDQGATCCARR